jgi:hypothetical protein
MPGRSTTRPLIRPLSANRSDAAPFTAASLFERAVLAGLLSDEELHVAMIV